MQKNKIGVLILALALVFTMAIPALALEGQGTNTITFTDVESTHKHYEAIQFCAQNGFMVGRGGGIFDPEGTISRGEFITVWGRTFHVQSHNFNDATKTHGEVDNAIVIMQGMGYINGVSGTEFSIDAKITREMVAKVAENTYLKGIDGTGGEDAYTDKADISDWALNAVGACAEKGTFDGVTSGGEFKPTQDITRSEVCQVLFNLLRPVTPTYLITIDSPITGGAVSADKTSAAEGETVTVTVTPGSNMRLVAGTLKFNTTDITETGGVYTFTMPDEGVTITAQFEAVVTTYTIGIDPSITGTGGTVTANKASAAVGETVTVTVTPDPDMQLVAGSLMFNSTPITEGNAVDGYTFTMPAENVVITAQFEPESVS